MIVVAAALAVAALLFPFYRANQHKQRFEQACFQLARIESWLGAYQHRYGDYPRPTGEAVNHNNESMISALRAARVLDERELAGWLEDTDGDGVPELVDPWGNPWIYFHPSVYNAEMPVYKIGGRSVSVRAAREGDSFVHPNRYQLWSCGPNQTDETGQGDDCGNIRQ